MNACPHYDVVWQTPNFAQCMRCLHTTTDGISFTPSSDKRTRIMPCTHYRIRPVTMRDETHEVWAMCDLCGQYTNDGVTFVDDMPSESVTLAKARRKSPYTIIDGMYRYYIYSNNDIKLAIWLATSEEEALRKYLDKMPKMDVWKPKAVKIEDK